MATLLITKQTGNFFDLQLDGGDIISSEINRLTTVGDFCHFKTLSGANIIKDQNVLYSDVTLIASGTFTFASSLALRLKLKEVGFFDGVSSGGGGGGGGVDQFTELLDTFNSYLGRDGQALVVNESELKIETVPFSNVSAFTDLSDTPNPLLPNKMIVTNSAGNALIMTNLPATPETYLNAVGTFHYADASSLVTPQAITASTPVKIENDGLGIYTNISNAPYGISVIYNIVTGQLDFSQLRIGDDVIFSPDLLITTSSVNQTLRVYLKMAIGSGSEWEKPLYQIEKKTAGNMVTGYVAAFDISEEATKNYPAELWIETDSSADVVNNGYYFKVNRKNINIVDLPTSIRQDVDFGVISSDAVDAINNAIPNILIQDQNLGQIKIQGTFNGVYHEYLFTGIKGYYGNGALQCTLNDLIEIGGSGGGGSETTATMGALIGSAGNATPNDSDYVATALTGGGLLKKITWTNVKVFLKTYFDTIYTNASDVATQISTALSGYLTSSTAAATYEPLKGTDDNYVTDAEKVIIGNTSGTNTGDQDLSGKQDTLVSGTNIKTINSTSILGSGDIIISGGGSGDMVLDDVQTVSGLKTFLSGKFGFRNVANTFTSFFTNTNTASRTYTLPNFSAGFVMDSGNQYIYGNKTLDSYLTFSSNAFLQNYNNGIRLGLDLSSGAGTHNTILGVGSSTVSSTGSRNTVIGSQAYMYNYDGSDTVVVGSNALSNTVGGGSSFSHYQSTFLGASTKPKNDGQTNQIVIGYNAEGNGSNTATLGNNSIVKTVLKGVINTSKTYTVATLPTGVLGDKTIVTDATAPTYLGALIGGGTVVCPVFFNGTIWVSN